MKIRDNRNKGWFWLNNDYLNGYARHLGSNCTVVYLSLCRHSDNNTQTCYPSMQTIAEENGIHRTTVLRAIKKLEEWDIISIKKIKKEDGTQANNIYTLVSKGEWKNKPSSTEQHGKPSSTQHSTVLSSAQNRVAQNNNNKTHINKTHRRKTTTTSGAGKNSTLISEIIKMFESINPACKRMYGNTNQRKACEFLLEEYSFERVKKIVETTLPKTNGMDFFPTITTPCKLRDKWSDLEVAIKRHISKQNTLKQKTGNVYL